MREAAHEPVITSPTSGGTYYHNVPITFTGTNLRGNTPSWSVTGDTTASASGNGATLSLPAGTYTLKLTAGTDFKEVRFTVIEPNLTLFNGTLFTPILLDWWSTGQACYDAVSSDTQSSSCLKYADGKFYSGDFLWDLFGYACQAGTDRDCIPPPGTMLSRSDNFRLTLPDDLTCNGTFGGTTADAIVAYTTEPLGTVTYTCTGPDGYQERLTRGIMFKEEALRGGSFGGPSGDSQGPSVRILSTYNNTEWIPFDYGLPVIHTDTPKFRLQAYGLESIHVTLNGTQVGGSNVKDGGGTFGKAWKHAPLTDSGMYALEIRETAAKPVLMSVAVQIIVPGDPVPIQETPLILHCSPELGCVPQLPAEQKPSNSTQQEPPQELPQQPSNSTQQEPPQELPQQPSNSTQQEPPQELPQQPSNSTQQEPPQDTPQQPQQPAKSSSVTLVHDGTDWVPFTSGMTVNTASPKFQGQTEGLGSIHITLDGTKVGGSKISDTGSFWKSWKHDPLNNGVYTLEIRESSGSTVLLSTTIRIAGQ